MKNMILIVLGALLLTACNPNKKEKAEALFTDSAMQDEIFNAILNDSARLQDFFDKVHMQRKGNGPMHQRIMQKTCCSAGMDSVMMCDGTMQGKIMRQMLRKTDRDSMFCKQMGDSVMQHKQLRMHLQQKMGQGGQGKQKRNGRDI